MGTPPICEQEGKRKIGKCPDLSLSVEPDDPETCHCLEVASYLIGMSGKGLAGVKTPARSEYESSQKYLGERGYGW